MKKRVLVLAAVLLLVCGGALWVFFAARGGGAESPASTSNAAPTAVSVEELGLSLTVPGGLYTITRSGASDAAGLAAAGIDAGEVQAFLPEADAWLDAFPADFSYEVMLRTPAVGIELEGQSLAQCGDAFIQNVFTPAAAEVFAPGVSFSPDEVLRTGDAAYAVFSFAGTTEDGATLAGQCYVTYRGGQAIGLSLTAAGTALSDAQKQLLRGMAESITFN